MGFAKFFQGLRKKEPQPDNLYGTGVWRQHRDRFNRAVDRFFVTASRLHEEVHAGAGTQEAHVRATEQLAALTHTLNQVAHKVDDCARTLHTHVPVNEQTIPAQVRTQVGTLPELMSRAATKVAEAAQAAAMVRAQVRTTSGGVTENSETDETSQAGPAEVPGVNAARRYVDDAARLAEDCHRIAERIASSDSSK